MFLLFLLLVFVFNLGNVTIYGISLICLRMINYVIGVCVCEREREGETQRQRKRETEARRVCDIKII